MTDQRVSDEPSTGRPPGGSSLEKKEQAQRVAHHAADRAGEVAGDATSQAKEVVQDAAHQARQLVGRARERLDTEARERSQQTAGALRQVVDQLAALSAGRPADAGPLAGYADQGRQSLARLADRLDQGPTAVLDDVRRFARRQPVVFLAAAGGLGFVVGRLVRGARDASSNGDQRPAYDSIGTSEELPPPVVVTSGPTATVTTAAVPPSGSTP